MKRFLKSITGKTVSFILCVMAICVLAASMVCAGLMVEGNYYTQAKDQVFENVITGKIHRDACSEIWSAVNNSENEPLVIQMSMYGGFEQVGPIGQRLPSDDVQTTTAAGDIVLYSSSQIVVFYGSNSWAYTRLGHITDQDASAMATLLGNGDVTITISLEEVK